MNERRAIRIVFGEGQRADCFDAETGERLLNVYRIELLFARNVSQARVVFDVISADASFTGVVCEHVHGPAHHKLSSPSLKFVSSDVAQRFTQASAVNAVTGTFLADEWRDFRGTP